MLHEIQAELKAPKGQYNSFGNYKYRSCEDIVEAAKPILHKHKLSLTITDDIVAIGERTYDYHVEKGEHITSTGNRFYVKATARILDENMKVIAETTAFAREEETKKGMDASQITGAASSYARKYALNGLFAIDDTKEVDTQDNRGTQSNGAIPIVEPPYIKELQAIKTMPKLQAYYEKNSPKYKSHAFNDAVVARKNEIKALEKTNEVA